MYTHSKSATSKPNPVIPVFPMTHCDKPLGYHLFCDTPISTMPWINMISQLSDHGILVFM